MVDVRGFAPLGPAGQFTPRYFVQDEIGGALGAVQLFESRAAKAEFEPLASRAERIEVCGTDVCLDAGFGV